MPVDELTYGAFAVIVPWRKIREFWQEHWPF